MYRWIDDGEHRQQVHKMFIEANSLEGERKEIDIKRSTCFDVVVWRKE